MNCVVRVVRGANQVLGIESHASAVLDIPLCDRIHVMNDESRVDLMTLDAEITTFISYDDISTKSAPSLGRIKPLVNPAVESERVATDLTPDREVLKPLLERFQFDQFGISSNLGTHRTLGPLPPGDFRYMLASHGEHRRSETLLAFPTP